MGDFLKMNQPEAMAARHFALHPGGEFDLLPVWR
jgi:hypothetical protein